MVPAVRLNRPVTDCEGSTIMVGDFNAVIGEISFFPFSLIPSQILEISQFGMTCAIV